MRKIVQATGFFFFILNGIVNIAPPCNADSSANFPVHLAEQASPARWQSMSATFYRTGSNQDNNASLQMKYLSNDCVLFSFALMHGNERKKHAVTQDFSAVMMIDGDGRFESPETPPLQSIDFSLSADGHRVTVTHSGTFSISPDGVYLWQKQGMELTQSAAGAILEFLPSVLTSLNSNNGSYTLHFTEDSTTSKFASVTARFSDSGTVLAKFLIAKDLHAIYRVDDDIAPVLIFGTAQQVDLNNSLQ